MELKVCSKELIAEYQEYLAERINDMDYTDIDCFIEDLDIQDEDKEEAIIEELLSLEWHVVLAVA